MNWVNKTWFNKTWDLRTIHQAFPPGFGALTTRTVQRTFRPAARGNGATERFAHAP
jgi:hypothetical protein